MSDTSAGNRWLPLMVEVFVVYYCYGAFLAIFDVFGNVQWAVYAASALSVASLICLYLARNPTAKAAKTA